MPGTGNSSHKHAGGHGRRPDRSRPTASSSSHHVDYDPTTFLFVVNELRVRLDEDLINGDPWFNRVPPTQPSGFEGEIPGCVMRYHNGQVTEAPGYAWAREGFQGTSWPRGYVYLYGPDGVPYYTDGDLKRATMYRELAVFSCNPLLPIVVDNGDPLSSNTALDRSPLLFFHPPSQPGVSQAVHPDSSMELGPAPCKYVAGASPSWIPSLVPKTYRNPYNAIPSVGLAGELPIVIGLMAFSEPGGDEQGESVTQTFLGGRWSGGQWHHTAAPRGYARSTAEDPRGFLVTIYYDPENPAYSTEDRMFDLQWKRVLVRDHR
ncbi:hypothetical protein V8C37DRAFT_37506 [Trichoderma ceciliae]